MDILHLIDRLEELLSEARRLPVGGGVVLNRGKARIAETEVVKAAQKRAADLVADAQGRAAELGRGSEEQARERLDEAQQASRDQMRESDVYALQTLRKLEGELEGFLATVRRGVDALEIRSADRPKD